MTRSLLTLRNQPLVNNLCLSEAAALSAPRWPLSAVYEDDLTIHLTTEVPPDQLYESYLYRSGVSRPYVDHCAALHQSLRHLRQDVVMDIGGNDGTLLKVFQERNGGNGRYINVDASESFGSDNTSAGIEYCHAFFNDELDLPRANIIVSTNVFQHTKDIHSFLRGIVKFLDGVWVLEFPYALTTLLTNQFDQFYHEHYYYWLITPLRVLFAEYGLKIIYMQELSIHGGTMRMWMTNKEPSASEVTELLDKYIQKESLLDLGGFQQSCEDAINKSRDFLSSLLGATAFFGAAAKGCVFLDAIGVDSVNMPKAFVVDDTTSKQGKFVPGSGFEVCPRERLWRESVDNIVVLAHNFAPYISRSLRNDGFNGRIITCLPSITEF